MVPQLPVPSSGQPVSPVAVGVIDRPIVMKVSGSRTMAVALPVALPSESTQVRSSGLAGSSGPCSHPKRDNATIIWSLNLILSELLTKVMEVISSGASPTLRMVTSAVFARRG